MYLEPVPTERLDQFSDHRLGPPAVGAFEIAVFHERDPSVGRATHVIDLGVDRFGHFQERRCQAAVTGEGEPPRQVVDRPEDDPGET
jgi:hypothetical protein